MSRRLIEMVSSQTRYLRSLMQRLYTLERYEITTIVVEGYDVEALCGQYLKPCW
jgi:hypothetical protein